MDPLTNLLESKQTNNFNFNDDDDFQVQHIDSVHSSDCFFSDYVCELVTKVFSPQGTSHHLEPDRFEGVLNADLTFNLHYLDVALDQLLATRDVSYDPKCTEEMNDYLEQVVPLIDCVFRQYDRIYKDDRMRLVSIIEPNLYWTGNWKRYFVDAIDIALNLEPTKLFGCSFPEEQNVCKILALSIITSGIEQALGNLVLTQSHFVPPLLKTLLTMPEMERLIDVRLLRLLKVIVGPPITINLRNILWHGFVNCTDHFTDPATQATFSADLLKFFYFLLAISATIGAELQKPSSLQVLNVKADDASEVLKARIVASIPQRKLYNFDEFAARLEPIFPTLDLELTSDCDYLRHLVEACPLIHRSMAPIWRASLRLFFDRQNHYRFYSLVLLMPLLESSLRYLYCSVNRLSNRLLTAICREYYVTFTEILSFRVLAEEDNEEESGGAGAGTGQMNRLFDLFPRPLMLLLLDAILLPEGLRFRDRLSHGQVALCSLNSTVANYVICSVIVTLQVTNCKLQPSSLSFPKVVQQITSKCQQQYECLYHPVYQLKTRLKSLLRLWQQFVGLSTTLVDEQLAQYEANLEVQLRVIEATQHDLFESYMAKCDQLVLLLRNCTANYERFVENLHTFLLTRSKELQQCKLRSRQRSNYQTMRDHVPLYLEAFCAPDSPFWKAMLLMLVELKWTTSRWCATVEEKVSLEKILKRLLQCAENLAQQSSITENQWASVGKLCAHQAECLQLIHRLVDNKKG